MTGLPLSPAHEQLMHGDVKWKALTSSDAGDCPPCLIKAVGADQLLIWNPQVVASLNPSDGQMKVLEPIQSAFGRKVIWSHPAYAGKTAYVRNDKELIAVDLPPK